MPTTPFLGIQQLTANQSQKEVTINDAILQLEAASCGTLAVPFPTLTVTLSVMQFTGYFFYRAGAATADAILQVPHAVNGNPTERLFGVRNTTGHGLTVRSDTTGGAVVVIPDGEARLLAISDNDVFIAAQPGVAAAFVGLSDVPHAYTAKGGQALVATMAEDGLEFVALVKNLDNLTDVDTVTTAPSGGMVLTYVAGRWQPAALPASASSFLALTDTPADYSGAANKFLRVNGAANGVEFISILQVPTGGTTGQVVTKGTGSTYTWADPTGSGSGVPNGGSTGQVLTKLSGTDGDADWEDPTGGSGGGGGDSGLYRFGGFFTTTPLTSEVLLLHTVTDAFTLPANLVGSAIKVGTNPAGSWVALVTVNGTTIGTITISTSGVVTCATTETALVIDDVVSIVAPVTADGSIANGAFTIRGSGVFASAAAVAGVQQQMFAARCRNYDATFTGGDVVDVIVETGDFRGVILQNYFNHAINGAWAASTPLVVPAGKVCVLLHGETDGYRFINGDYAKMEIWNTTTNTLVTEFGTSTYARSGSFFVQGADGTVTYPITAGIAGDHIECRVYSANDGHTRCVGMEAIFAFVDPDNPSSFDSGAGDGSGGGSSLPDGGTTGQVLAKLSGTDGDADWIDAPSGEPSEDVTRFYGTFAKWNAAKARGTAAPARALFSGDSNIMGQGSISGTNDGAFLTNLARRFADLQNWQTGSILGNQNVGNTGDYHNYNPTIAFTGGWGVASGGADIVGGVFFTCPAGGGGAATWTPTESFTHLRVTYPTNPGLNAAMTVTIDGTLVDTINLNTTAGVHHSDYTVSAGAHTVVIASSGSGDAYFHSLEINDASGDPVFMQAGWSGAKAADFVKTTNAWSSKYELGDIAPDYTFHYCTINDSDAQTAGDTYYNAIEAFVRVASATSDGCLVVGIPAGVPGTVNGWLNSAVQMLRNIAKDYGWSFYDLRRDLGHSWPPFNDKGYADDNYHPNVAGHPFIAGKLDDFLGSKL